MSTEIPVLYSQIKKEFDTALKNAAEGEYVPKPKSLYRYAKLKKEVVTELKNQNETAKNLLNEKSEYLISRYGITKLEAINIVLEVQAVEQNLKNQGAIFGNEVFNFALERPILSKQDYSEISSKSEQIMTSLIKIGKDDLLDKFSNLPLSPTERKFENLGLSPNAARIDFILTSEGPKIIEVNSQWVDAINALSGFAYVYGDTKASKNIIETLADMFPRNSNLAIINILQTSGSRELGATKELEILSSKLTKTNKIKTCEVIDPNKVRLSYLDKFDSFYLNLDPRAIGYQEPDWINFILKKVSSNPKSMFPRWRPILDKKVILTQIPKSNEYLVPTIPLAEFKNNKTKVVLKGDGYSLNSVFTSLDPMFNEYLEIALKDPEPYVIQPFVESKKISCWAYDSGSKKIKYIEKGYTKLNVWWINGKVVGILATISESPLISDKGFNTYPLIKD